MCNRGEDRCHGVGPFVEFAAILATALGARRQASHQHFEGARRFIAMVKSSAKVVKGKAGKVVAKPASKRSAKKAPALDPEVVAQKASAQAKSKARRAEKKSERVAERGFDSLGEVSNNKDIEWIRDWLNLRPQMIGYVFSLMRNGLIEKSWSKRMDTAAVPKHLGKRLVGGTGGKFRSLAPSAAVALLAEILPDPNIKDRCVPQSGRVVWWLSVCQADRLVYCVLPAA